LAPFVLGPVLALFYSIPLMRLRGQTLGMMAVGIRAETEAGSHPNWGRAALRWLVGSGPWMIFPIFGGIVALIFRAPRASDPKHRGLHDRAGGVVVVRL
jgi:uncharacterized RDD family membrane protein YckC